MLTEALDNKDLIEIGRLAHSLKGLCANICAIPLKDISSCIEKAAENENLDDITQLRGEFESEFARLKDTLLKRFPPQKRSPWISRLIYKKTLFFFYAINCDF